MTDKQMTDGRLAEIEARHDYASKYFCGNEPHPQAHKHRGELLQALKAESEALHRQQRKRMNDRKRIRELEQSAAKKDNAIISYQKRIRELEIKIERVQCAADELAEALADD